MTLGQVTKWAEESEIKLLSTFLFSPDLLLATRQTTNNFRVRETCLAGMLDALATRGETSHAGQNTVCCSTRGSITFEQGVRPCFSSPTPSCVRCTLKVLSHLESSVTMIPDHGMKGQTA